MSRVLLFAPNVHTGGGLVLLQELLKAWPADAPLMAWLDRRASDLLCLPARAEVRWAEPSVISRFAVEWQLARTASPKDRVLCFHGLPTLLSIRPDVQLFLQNRNYLGQVPLHEYGWRTRLRNRAEQWISRLWRYRVSCYYVQSPTMARALQDWWGKGDAPLVMLPFVADLAPAQAVMNRWDFVFVADGEPHKNHRRLVEAWVLLAREGIRPSLALTLTVRHRQLLEWIETEAACHGLRISNVPQRSHAEMSTFYASTGALIFPSMNESFGLPLVEASRVGRPILASERDFVRDVCEPAQTFDPESAISIARAVRRHLGLPESTLALFDAAGFLDRMQGGPPG